MRDQHGYRSGLRVAAGRRGVAFHIGGGVHVTAAHCVDSLTAGDVVRAFGKDLRLTRFLAGDVAVMTAREQSDRVFAVAGAGDPGVTVGAILSFECWRSVHAVGTMRVVAATLDALIAHSESLVRPLPGDSGAPVYLSSSKRVVGLIRGAIGPGVLQNQIVIQRLDARTLREIMKKPRKRVTRRPLVVHGSAASRSATSEGLDARRMSSASRVPSNGPTRAAKRSLNKASMNLPGTPRFG
jgi:hypothetical protein